jgi:adenosylcobinamide-phosphate synthase
MSGATGVRMGGPNYYGGILVEKPFIGDDLNGADLELVYLSIKTVILSSVLFISAPIILRSIS